ncbi:hypothetical protein [Micromonospora sp. SL4-19]|uniref:hypothetical protein n=1 Tax=Micromonospora sp. SL4-19 TaxID=3399129 RepID=UPI003A4E3D69
MPYVSRRSWAAVELGGDGARDPGGRGRCPDSGDACTSESSAGTTRSGGREMGLRGRLSLGLVVLMAGCTATSPPVTPAVTVSSSAEPAATGCASQVETGALPDWADEGFSGDSRIAHVFGAKGDIVAVLFAHPLAQQRKDGSNNKILWVSRPVPAPADATSSDNLMITATLDGTDSRVTHAVTGGPGPSIIDMPRAGCWHLELRWSGHTDTMDLVYAETN